MFGWAVDSVSKGVSVTISPRSDALLAAVIFMFANCGASDAGMFTMHCCIYGVR